jgi:hypothetical protein
MRLPFALPALLLALAAGCDDTLTVEPVNDIPQEQAIVDAASARAAILGAYDALQDDVDALGRYYGGDFTFLSDLPADNVVHTGTFDTYLEVDRHLQTADNGTIEGVWEAIYAGIHRANVVLARVPEVDDPALGDEERNQILGEAHFLRALHYHNLVKLWGGVPLRLEPASQIGDISSIPRSSVDDVYAQILSDLDQAATLITDDESTRRASLGAVAALRSRVLLYRQDWAGTVAAADQAASYGYSLAPAFEDLFTADGSDTPEDVFRVPFTATEFNYAGYYYSIDGRLEIAPSCELMQAYDPVNIDCADPELDLNNYDPVDARGAWTIGVDDDPWGAKYPTTTGAEDLHAIRFAEVLLNRAEANARLGDLAAARDDVNQLRERAGVDLYTAGDFADQQAALELIWNERLLELSLEGDRWPDLVRTGRAIAVLGLSPDQEHTLLWPIPQNERDISGIDQNPGY